ncbi:3'-5' exonuclease [Rubellicoccus peritrichatus]|uniref:3'-5' exonuclease n=1 Tax=Rubellicoccus peritrichatus TaxID=3080537 RepID=A0AAQ3QXE4_9BACT|nr:3'-5' exonuclease [Puniceicoccus sp. CR14]WOO42780.1 3'-5' exonuclease [Puniceicoccus sp. CR14]
MICHAECFETMETDWTSLPIHVIDFEGSNDYGVIEYGIAVVQDAKVVECHSGVCEAEDEISQSDSWKHGLRRQDTEGQPNFAKHWELFNALRKRGPFAAHHASVENRLLKRSWPHPSASPSFYGSTDSVTSWGPWIDSRAIYQKVYPDLSEHKLGSLIETFQLQEQLDEMAMEHCPNRRCKYHCALYDALASAQLLIHLGNQGGFEDMTIEWLIEMSASTSVATELRQPKLL